MTFSRDQQSQHLPAPSPDLVVIGQGDSWRLQRLSPRLALLAGVDPDQALGQPLAGLFQVSTPALVELAREAAGNDQPLADILTRLSGPRGSVVLEADVHPGGLTPDYCGREVRFFFREPVRPAVPAPGEDTGLVGASPGLREMLRKIALYGPSDAAVVITGETGTGKELVARALHRHSPRRDREFVAVNCTAISGELLESELFGHEKGAFTGALRSHRGRFERADGGTLFLDEIGDMPANTQAKLLRVLEDGRVERVGAEQPRQVDVRVVAATNVALEQAVGQGRFRADLYHRLSVLRIHLPPLRERPEDIPPLVEHFLAEFSIKYRRQVQRLTPEALNLLQSYLWPGNVRELRNVLERVFVETGAEVIGARAFAEWIRERRDFLPGEWNLAAAARHRGNPVAPQYPLATERYLLGAPGRAGVGEAELMPSSRPAHSTRPAELDAAEIRRAYRAAGGNLTAAARLLGVHRATLYRYLAKLELKRENLDHA
jgi:sigma-54 specific flagellar transcriptional regulator A